MSSKMAASVHDMDYQELNAVFKSLGERVTGLSRCTVS